MRINDGDGSAAVRAVYRPSNGFTLIELVVAVVIVGILVAMAIPSFRDRSRDAEVAAIAKEFLVIYKAVEVARADNGVLPSDANSGEAPPELHGLLTSTIWDKKPLGGAYDWNGPGTTIPTLGVSIRFYGAGVTDVMSELSSIDQILDDGNLNTGLCKLHDFGGTHFFQWEMEP